jgi:hypothetical protein
VTVSRVLTRARLCRVPGGIEPAKPARKRPVKAEEESLDGEGEGGAGGASGSQLPKKKRGRPPKSALLPQSGGFPHFAPNTDAFNAAAAALGPNGTPPSASAQAAAAAAAGGMPSIVGSRVEGIVDAAFDVGYFLTIRIAGAPQARLTCASHMTHRCMLPHCTSADVTLRACAWQLVRAIVFRPDLCGGQVRRRRYARVVCDALFWGWADALPSPFLCRWLAPCRRRWSTTPARVAACRATAAAAAAACVRVCASGTVAWRFV